MKKKKMVFKLSYKILLLPVCGEIIKMPVVGLIPLTERKRSCIWILGGISSLRDKAAVIDSTRGWVWRSSDLSDAWACQLTNESQSLDVEHGHTLMAWSRESQHWLTQTCVCRRGVLLLWGDKELCVCANIHYVHTEGLKFHQLSQRSWMVIPGWQF